MKRYKEYIKERIDWRGNWINDEHPLDKVSEYTLKQDLIKELNGITKKYQGRVKDQVIEEALITVSKKYTK